MRVIVIMRQQATDTWGAHTAHALIGFQGRMLQAWSEEHNFFLKPLKKKGFKEERVTTIGLYDIGTSHDPGIQQEPRLFVGSSTKITLCL